VKGMTEGEEVRRRRGVLASGTSRLECCRGSSWTSWWEGRTGQVCGYGGVDSYG
jgi:hypothetical protein